MERVWMMLLLPPLCGGQHIYQGTVMTYHYLHTDSNGTVTMEYCRKSNAYGYHSFGDSGWPTRTWSGSKRSSSINSIGGSCQTEVCNTVRPPLVAPFLIKSSSYRWFGPDGVVTARASMLFEVRRRSDTGKPNTSPQTTLLPVYRVPYNCPRDVHLLNFDPDGDLVRCRFADKRIDPTECELCSPPSMLSLSPDCTLSISDSSKENYYAVELVMEDFPRTDINLTHPDGSQEQRRTTDAISKIPVQLLLRVNTFAPSCSPGQYIPRFVGTTPEHGAKINVTVGHTVQIHIKAEASHNSDSDLGFSGPAGMTKTCSGGHYILSWTPGEMEVTRSFPVCFTAITDDSRARYCSEFRCVVVNVGKAPPKALKVFHKVWMQSSSRLTDEAVKAALVEQIKKELAKRGLPAKVSLNIKKDTHTNTSTGKPRCPTRRLQ